MFVWPQPPLLFITPVWTLSDRPFIFSSVVLSYLNVRTESLACLVYLPCVQNPFSDDPSPCTTCDTILEVSLQPQGVNPKCTQFMLSAKVPYQCLCTQPFRVFQFDYMDKGIALSIARQNLNFAPLFALNVKPLGPTPFLPIT